MRIADASRERLQQALHMLDTGAFGPAATGLWQSRHEKLPSNVQDMRYARTPASFWTENWRARQRPCARKVLDEI
eukprot:3759063-Alexandrium_andersonii.AAC.1